MFRMLLRIIVTLLVAVPTSLLLARLWTELHTLGRLYSVEEAPEKRVAIVFGAGLWRDGTPGLVLRDRVETAADLYFAGKVEKLLMSGDNRFVYYNEPEAMRQYALKLGVPDEAIVLDYAGRRTYDTCYRASAIFGVSEAILVTQRFHLARALYTCNQLGVPAVGVAASRYRYRRSSMVYWQMRETGATLAALWDVHIARPLPVLGNPEPIFPLEAQ